jgi:EAL and modified HD-GYP domain-containing signal transduction protein
MSDIYIGRQPIYDRKLSVYAYELLFRGTTDNAATVIDGDSATSNVIVNTFMEIGLDNIVGSRPAFINLTRSFFTDQQVISLPRDRVVLELLEDIEPDEEVIRGVRRLSEQGYTIALDDFIYHESLKPLIDLADIIKIDIMRLDQGEVRDHVQQLRHYSTRLLAEKVETRQEHELCMDLGFDYFQGYFLAQPKVIRGRRLPNNRLAILELMSRLQDPDVQFEELQELISSDPGFCYRILQYVNSAAFGLNRKVDSVHRAIALLGLQKIRNMATMLAMARIDNKPTELVTTAMLRAKMCERLAIEQQEDNAHTWFTVGLLSALDALMDNSMEEILTQLRLTPQMSEALLHHSGRLGRTLSCVLAYERGWWELIQCDNLDKQRISDCYLTALQWATRTSRQLLE